jgi:hypothetical protein
MAKKKQPDAEEPEDGTEPTTIVVPERPQLHLRDHPRAQFHIKRIRSLAAVVGFVLAALLSLQAGLPAEDVLIRALGVGIAARFVFWAGAVLVWRQLAAAEIEVARRKLLARLDEIEAEAAARRAGSEAPTQVA